MKDSIIFSQFQQSVFVYTKTVQEWIEHWSKLGIDVIKDTHAHWRTFTHPCTHPHTHTHPYTQCMWIFSCMFTTPFSHSFKTVHRQRKYPDYKYQIYLLLIAFVLGCALENKEGKPSMIVYAYFTCASMYRANPPTPWSSLSITWLWTAPPPRPFCDRAE